MTMASISNNGFIGVTTNYTTTLADNTIEVTGAGGITITIFDATTEKGNEQHIKNSSASNITITGTSGQTFDGSVTATVIPLQSLNIQSNGTNFFIK